MIHPTVHMNGSGERNLRDQWAEAYGALGDAVKALARATPHGRDYYVQDGDALKQAQAEHRERMDALWHMRQ